MRKHVFGFIALFLAFALNQPTALAAKKDVVKFYKGNQVKLIVGYSAGGGYDTYGRLLARHMGRHIPGNPDITVQNMPGAGSLKLINYLNEGAKADGTVFGTASRDIVTLYAFDPDGYDFDPSDLSWIGSMNKELSVCASWHESPIKNHEDMLNKEFIVARSGRGGGGRAYYPLMTNLFGAKFKTISGYTGGSEMNLAIERGEVHGRCAWSWSSITSRSKAWLDGGKINIILQLAMEKHPDLPDVPLILDLTDDPDERKVIELVFSSNLMGRPFIAPPGVPAERIDALRKAFQAALQDPDLLAEAKKMDLEIQLMSGNELQKLVGSLVNTPPDILELARETIRDTSESSAAPRTKGGSK